MPSEKTHSPLQRIEDILDNIDRVRTFVEGYDFSSFVADHRTLYAVTRALEIVSEASRHLPVDIKARFPQIDWRGIAAVGNVYRHGYDSIDNVFVWDVVIRDLEPLRLAMLSELQSLGVPRN